MFEALIAWFKRKLQQRRDSVMFERQVVVTFDEVGVSAAFPQGQTQAIAWQDVDRVAIETNDGGPWSADVWWVLEGNGKRVSYPQGATGDSELLDLFPLRFPGFDDSAVIEAMGCTSNARFVCWRRGREDPA